MASSPWAVTKRKRESTPKPTSAPRKRLRPNEEPTSTARQQTLTQAQWISTPVSSLNHDTDLHPIEIAQLSARRSSKYRDSTLTQMDFFKDRVVVPEIDADLLRAVDDAAMPPPPLPQMDGNHDGPRKPRRRNPSIRSTVEEIEAMNPQYSESQEYHPSKKRRKAQDTHDNIHAVPRKSARLGAHPLQDKDQNLAVFEKRLSLSLSPLKQQLGENESTPDIERSTVTDDDKENLTARPPQTPSRKGIIKSSQSPESLPPSTSRRRQRSVELPLTRSPLREVSGNNTAFTTLRIPRTHRLSRRRPLPRSTRVEDSQVNIYSCPRSSSSLNVTREVVPTEPHDHVEPTYSPSKPLLATDAQAEIPATSQSRAIGSSPPTRTPDDHDLIEPQLQKGDPRVGDVVQDTDDDASDFGSPIANDTQYNVDLDRRTSSPSRSQAGVSGLDIVWNEMVSRSGKAASNDDLELEEAIANAATPTPQLVSGSRPQSKDGPTELPGSVQEEAENHLLPTINEEQAAFVDATTSRLPLNDVLPTSSPAETSNRTTTQRSIRPLSMPHPSQISTQEPTQALLGLSSMMQQDTETQTQSAAKAITIKDSSSVRVPLSQIPPHESSQIQGHAVKDFGLDGGDSEDDEDYDLDPPSEPPARPTTTDEPVGKQGKKATAEDENPSSTPTEKLNPSELPPHFQRALHSSSQINEQSGRPRDPTPENDQQLHNESIERVHEDDQIAVEDEQAEDSQLPDDDLASSPPPDRPTRQYSPIPGFNNETQSNFTQDGHVTAAYIHRQRELGVLPKWFVPKPHRVPGYTGR